MMKRFWLAAWVLLLGYAGSAFADTFQNGSFEIGASSTCGANDNLLDGSTAIPGWTVVGSIDWAGTCNWTSQEGSHSLDLIGGGATGVSIGGVQQTFDTITGGTYQVSFYLAANPSPLFLPVVKPLTVTVAGTTHGYNFDRTGHDGLNMGWVQQTFTFVATGPTSTIKFLTDLGATTSFAGVALDNVSIVQIAPTPWVGGGGIVNFGISNPSPPVLPVNCTLGWTTSSTAAYPSGTGAFPPTVLNGTAGPAVLSYNASPGTQSPSTGMCGSWTLSTVAVAAGNVALNWSWTEFHSFFHVTAELSANVIRGGTTVATYSLLAAGPQDCCTPPSNGGTYSGQVSLPGIQAGDTVNFVVTGSHYDGTDVLSGTLTLTGTQPTTISPGSSINPAIVGNNVTFTATVSGSNPAGTVAFTDGANVISDCNAVALVGVGNTRTASCSTSSLTIGNHGIGLSYSGDIVNAGSANMLGQVINAAAPLVAAPSLIRVVEDLGGGSAFVIGRVDSAPPQGTLVQAFTATSCVGGAPSGVGPIGSPVPLTATDGYFGATVSGVTSGQFVALKLTSESGTPISDVSACLPSLGNNDFWTTALLVGDESTSAGSSSVGDYIDASGKTRWYKFKVAPGQRIAVTLSGLPADYDLTMFKDIGAAFAAQLAPADSAALTKLSAEFAPSAFSPSAFSPSAFSPSAFSPSAFSPSAFSPSAFSPSAFSPSAFSPSAFSPSAFSPSAFSPSAFSPSAFSPSAFSPSAFSPSAFSPSAFSQSPDIVSTAFSSAQTRSIIAVSATPGTGDESAIVDSWNNSGYFYARVTGRGGAFSTTGQFNIGVAKGATSCAGVSPLPPTSRTPGSSYKTVILTDSSRLIDDGTLAVKLATFAGRSEIGGVVYDVAGDTRVGALKTQAAANSSCPYATNLVAEEIKSIVDSYRNPNLKYVVIAGGDDVIPFFRYPDESLLGQESGYVPPVTGVSDASLRGDYVLSQDAYGSRTRISLRTSDFPVPGLAVGRLVKTPAEIAGMIDAYTAATVNGTTVRPGSSLVTGYDFLADVANAVTTELLSGTGAAPDQLIAANGVAPENSWKATDLGAALFSRRHDVVFLAGHFSANSTLAADFATNLITSDVAASTTDFTNSIVFSAGCHSGYSIVNRDALPGGLTFTLDWAQAFAQKKATLIAGTGYQYGDTDFIEYSERLYLNFAKELRAGTGPVAVGEALVKAKLDYLAATPDIRGIHKKALLESTLYGLPMLGVNMPSGRGGGGSVLTPVIATNSASGAAATTLGLRIADLHLNSSDLGTTLQHQQLTGATKNIPGPMASWLSGNVDGVVSNPAEPALPLKVVNVTPIDGTIVLRGVGFRGGSYGDSQIVPLTGAPATEIRGVHVSFASPYFFPMRPWTVNYFGALAGNGATSLLVTPAQHRAADLDPAGTGALRSTLRSFNNLDLRLYYSGNYGNSTKQVSLSDAPTIVSVGAQPAATGGGVTFTAQVTGDPAAAIHQVWVMYTNGGTWVPVDLAQCIGTSLPSACGTLTDSQIWKGTDASAPAGSLQFVVQAANGLGLVTFDDNRGAYYPFTGTVAPQEPASTALSFVAAPATALYGDAVSVTAQLMTSNGTPVGGSIVTVNIGGMGNAGTTGSDGRVRFDAVVANAPGNYQIEASYLGSSTTKPTSIKRSFVVSAAPASLALLPSPAVGVTLKAPVVNGNVTTQEPVAGQSVSFLLTGSGFSQTVVVNTDTAGNATLPTAGLPAGTYSIAASFLPASVAGSVTNYAGATLALPAFVMNAQSVALTTPAAVTYAAPGTFAVSAAVSPNPNSGQSIKITSTTPTVCTVTGTPAANQASYTATIVTAGEASTPALCKLTAQIAGSNTFAPTQAAATIAITKAAQTITFAAPATLTFTQSTSLPTLTNAAAVQPITYTVMGQCSVAANVVTANSGTGSCAIAAIAPGTPLYSAYSNSSFASITLAKATLIISPSISPRSFTYGDDLAPSPIPVTYDSTYSVTPACVLNSAHATLTPSLPAPPVSAGPYNFMATLDPANLSTSCNPPTSNTATLTVYKAQAAFTNVVAPPTAPVRTAVTITGNLNRVGKAEIYPKAADLGGGAFAVALRNAGGTVKTYAPSLSDPNGSFTITDNALAPDTYTLEFNYTGGPNFLAATKSVSALRVVGFASSGIMSQARTSHTATLLNDGRVLVAGGVTVADDKLRGIRTAEIYCPDPYTPPAVPARTLAQWCPNGVGKFSPAGRGNTTQIGVGNMVQARAFHTATLLPDGTVLLTGGYNQSDIFTSTAEIYDATDPVADRFTAVGSLPSVLVAAHTATLITKNSKPLVLVVGGGSANSQLYDPVTKTWTRSGSMTGLRFNHTASLVGAGGTKVFVAGGIDSQGKTLQTTTIYDIAAGTFAGGPTMLAPRQLHTASAIANGKVLLAGGTGGSNNTVAISPLAEIYDPVATTPFTPAAFASNTGRFAHSASALGAANAPDGRVLIAGGSVGIACGQILGASEVYAGGFTSGAAMTAARVSHTATVLKDGRVLIAGGIGVSGSTCAPLNTTEIWNAPP